MKIKKLSEDAQVPTYATSGSACFDLYANTGEFGLLTEAETFGTSIAFEIPDNHVMLVFSRSGHGFNHDVRLANAVGVIDSDFRNEVKVRLTPDESSSTFLDVQKGDRIAQAMVLPVERVYFEVVEELSETKRGIGGFGSSGK